MAKAAGLIELCQRATRDNDGEGPSGRAGLALAHMLSRRPMSCDGGVDPCRGRRTCRPEGRSCCGRERWVVGEWCYRVAVVEIDVLDPP